MSVTEAIRCKGAVRAYTPDPVPEAIIEAILNAGRRTQSSKGHTKIKPSQVVYHALQTQQSWRTYDGSDRLIQSLVHRDGQRAEGQCPAIV